MAKKLFKDIVSTSGVYFIVSIIGIISGILFPRLLGPDQWGLWSLTTGLVWLLAPLAQVAMSTTLTTYISKYKGNKEKVSSYVNSAYFVAILSGFIVSITLILLSDYLASSVFQDDRLKIFLLLAAGIIFFDQLNIINRDYYRGYKDFKIYNIFKLIPSLSILVLTLSLLMIYSYRAIYLVISHVSIAALFCILVLIYMFRKEETFKLFKLPKKNVTKKVLKFGVPLIFTMTFMTIMKSVDRVLIGYFLETSDVGIYSVAAGIPLMIGSMFAPISTVLLPTFSERESKGESSELILKEVFSFLLFISIPLIIFIILFSQDILQIVFGEEYMLGAMVLSLTSVEIFLFSGERLLGASVVASERTTRYALGMGISAISNISMNIILIPIWGIEGAAIATVLSFLILFIVIISLSKKEYRFNVSQLDLTAIIFLIGTMIVSGILLKKYLDGMVSFITTLVVFGLILLVSVELSRPRWYMELKTYIKEISFL
ncbi:MAG: flippase [Candidatus Saliniplasma sp.]